MPSIGPRGSVVPDLRHTCKLVNIYIYIYMYISTYRLGPGSVILNSTVCIYEVSATAFVFLGRGLNKLV